MSNEGVLRRVLTGPRTKQDIRAGKNIRIDEHDMERYSDFFTDNSKTESESFEPSKKENTRVSEKHESQGMVTLPSMPSFSPLSISNKTNVSTHSVGMILRNKKCLDTSHSNTNSKDSQKPPDLQFIHNEDDQIINLGSEPFEQRSEESQLNNTKTHNHTKHLQKALEPNQERTSVGSLSADDKYTEDAGKVKSHMMIDYKENEKEHVDSDDGGAVEATEDEFILTNVEKYVLGEKLSLKPNDSPVYSKDLLMRSQSGSATNISKKRKRKKKCDLFTIKKIRKKSLRVNNSKESEPVAEESLGLSPIYPTNRKIKLTASTPAVTKLIGRFPDTTSISESASSLPVVEGKLTDTFCPSSSDPLLLPQSSVLQIKPVMKSVTFDHTVNKQSVVKALGASTTVLPSFTTAEPLHYFETTFKNKVEEKKKIIHPEPGNGNVRRSKRTRVAPLEWYKNERIKYRKSKNGLSVVGITTPQKSPKQPIRCIIKRMEKKVEKKKKFQELSVHIPVNENLLKLNSNIIEVLDYDTKETKAIPCFFKYNQYTKTSCLTRQLATDDDPVVMVKPLQTPYLCSGHVEIRPLKQKKLQLLKTEMNLFVVLHGKVEVTIHESSFILETKDMFIVPPGNVYGIRNLRNEDAHLSFVTFRNWSSLMKITQELKLID